MKLEYNILWLDNDLEEYIKTGDVNSINEYLIELGFEPNIVTVFDEADIDQYLNINYDLIISDFNLNNENGDVIIYRLREEKRLDTEILFYSAKTNFVEDKEVKERLAFMERINIQIGRDNLLDKIEKVIGLTIEKLLELNATRGLITSATSDLDAEIEELFNSIIKIHFADELKFKIEKIFKTDYKEIKKNLLNKCKSQRDTHSADFTTYFSQSDSFRKWNILKKLINLNVPVGFDLDLFKNYKTEVIDIRNKFAHAKSEEINGKMFLRGQFGKEGFQFDKDACIQIRKKLIKHKRNFENLKLNLNNL